jgi:hypothetical protein
MECMWFSQPATIPGEPSLPSFARTMNTNVSSGPDDFSRTMPWRAPGSAPVYGSGCGVAGGGPISYDNGGNAPPGYKNGDDFLDIPATTRVRSIRPARSAMMNPPLAYTGLGSAVCLNHCRACGDARITIAAADGVEARNRRGGGICAICQSRGWRLLAAVSQGPECE